MEHTRHACTHRAKQEVAAATAAETLRPLLLACCGAARSLAMRQNCWVVSVDLSALALRPQADNDGKSPLQLATDKMYVKQESIRKTLTKVRLPPPGVSPGAVAALAATGRCVAPSPGPLYPACVLVLAVD